jgi:hypothetical protein
MSLRDFLKIFYQCKWIYTEQYKCFLYKNLGFSVLLTVPSLAPFSHVNKNTDWNDISHMRQQDYGNMKENQLFKLCIW